jgi:cupin 2 domain-containing protein
MTAKNIFEFVPDDLSNEVFEVITQNDVVKIERIVSKGHSSPETGWYDQDHNEWVMVLKGEAIISFDDNTEVKLSPGDYLNLTTHTKHKVKWTKPDAETVWLAVHY